MAIQPVGNPTVLKLLESLGLTDVVEADIHIRLRLEEAIRVRVEATQFAEEFQLEAVRVLLGELPEVGRGWGPADDGGDS